MVDNQLNNLFMETDIEIRAAAIKAVVDSSNTLNSEEFKSRVLFVYRFLTNTLLTEDSHELNISGDIKEEIEPYIKPLINKLIEMKCPPELASESANRIFDNFFTMEGFGGNRYRFIKNPDTSQKLENQNCKCQKSDN